MKNNRLVNILVKQLTNRAASEELEELRNWEEKSADNHQQAEALRETWEWGGRYDKEISPDVDAGWNRFKSRMQEDKKRQIPAKPVARPTSAKRVSLGFSRFLMRAAAVAAVLVSITFMAKNYLQPSNRAFVVSTTAGQQEKVELTDGSIVWLNENSELTFSNPNNRQERRAKLSGEAFFDVQRNPEKPFIIETDDTQVRVLGTSFNVRALPNEEMTEVAVKSGTVAFKVNPTEEEIELTANEKGTFWHQSTQLEEEADANLNAISWHSKTLSFKKTSLVKVLTDLERYYGVNLELADDALKNCKYNSPFVDAPLSEVLESFKTTYNLRVEKINDRNYRLHGGSCD